MAVKRVHAAANLASENGLHHSSPADLKTLDASCQWKFWAVKEMTAMSPRNMWKAKQSMHALFVNIHDMNKWAHTIQIP